MTTKNNYKSEAGHWYDHDGKPVYTIVGVNGKETNDELNHSPGFEPGYIYTFLHTKGGLRVTLR